MDKIFYKQDLFESVLKSIHMKYTIIHNNSILIIYFEELPIFLLTYKYRTKFVTSLLRASMNSPT